MKCYFHVLIFLCGVFGQIKSDKFDIKDYPGFELFGSYGEISVNCLL